MISNNTNNVTLLCGQTTTTITLPTTFQKLVEICQSIAKADPKILYLESKDIIEIDDQDSYQEYTKNTQFNSKVLYIGTGKDDIEIASKQLQDYLRSQNTDQQKAMHCMKCYGTKFSKKGTPCNRCNGSGEICEKDLKLIASCIKEVVSTQVDIELDGIKQSISQSIVIESLPKKEIPVKKVCEMCKMEKSLLETEGKLLCEDCISSVKPNGTLTYKSKLISNSLGSNPYVCRQIERVNFSIAIENTGNCQWPGSTAIYPLIVEPSYDALAQYNVRVGSIKGSEKTSVNISIDMPKTLCTLKMVWKLGYRKAKSIIFFGGIMHTNFMVIYNPEIAAMEQKAFEANLNNLMMMGYDRAYAESKLKETNNDIDKALTLLSQQNYYE